MKQRLQAETAAPRLDLWLHERFPEHSRSRLQRLIREGHVTLRGRGCPAKSSVAAGDAIEIEFPEPKPAALEPEAIPLEILFEDEHLLVLNKPPGLVVHPGAGRASGTLVHALLHHCRGQLSGIGGEERPGIVHRLDQDTSGCLVAAKSDAAHRRLAEHFQSRSLEKTYLALVWGEPRPLSGRVDRPIGRHPVHRQRMAVTDKGRGALTEWKVRERFGKAALLECRIHTGRTHQIRVHLAHLGHPVVGDAVYGRARDAEIHRLAGRQMLHAWRLAFEHPITGRRLECEAPFPPDMRRLLERLRGR